jgi:hypothetical protein
LARKADLRPSPLEITQNRDLLCLSAHFHINYLPDLMETFVQLLPGRAELEIEDALLQGPVREAALLDASLAKDDVRVELAEAAWMSARRANHLYAQETAHVSPAQVAAFHLGVLGRKGGFSLLLGSNESSIISGEQLRQVLKSAAGLEGAGKWALKIPDSTGAAYFGGEVRIEDASPQGSNHALLAFSLPKSGISEANFPANWILQSILAVTHQETRSVYSSLSADASLHGVYFEAPGAELKPQISAFLDSLKKFKLDEVAFEVVKQRAFSNYAHSLDSRRGRLLSFANQFALRGAVLAEAEMKEALDGVKAEQFADLLMEALKKPTLVCKGALKELPYLADF